MTANPRSFSRHGVLALVASALALSGCARDNEIDITAGVGITATRSVCPTVGVPVYTGDVTMFDPATSRVSTAIDVVATITNVRTNCNDSGPQVYVAANFDVIATRRDAGAAREIVLPYYSAVVQGGTAVVAKDNNQVVIRFAEGATRATVSGFAGAYVDRAAATLPDDIRERITRRRRAGQDDAAIDPLSEPDVRAAITRATFELLIGFQLSQEQLQYNVTR